MKPVGEPDAGNPHVRFDERGWETERCRMAQAVAPILDSTISDVPGCPHYVRYRGHFGQCSRTFRPPRRLMHGLLKVMAYGANDDVFKTYAI